MGKVSNKYTALIKDTFFLALSAYVPKVLSFFLVPIYTNCLTTSEYGTIDLLTTTISFLVPIFTLGIDNATLRFTIINKEDKRPYQISLKIALQGSVIICGIVLLNIFFEVIKIEKIYQIYFLVVYFLKVVYGINTAYLRAEDNLILLSKVSIIYTVIFISSNIITLLLLKLGIIGFLFSDLFAFLVCNIIVGYNINFVKLINGIKEPFNALQKEMLEYSVPLVISSIAWWINSASDKYFILYLCGVAANGIYSVAYKIPTILKLMQNVFYQAWILSIYKEYNKENGKQYVSKIYDLYNGVMVLGCSFIILLNIPLSRFLYAKDFFEAWKYVPALLISIVFVANAGFYESILSVYKKTKLLAGTTVVGAIVNTILNFVLISNVGIQGAAIATAVGYFVMWITKIPMVHKLYDFKVNWLKHGSLVVLLVAQAVVMVGYQNYLIGIAIFSLMVVLNYKAVVSASALIFKKICKN